MIVGEAHTLPLCILTNSTRSRLDVAVEIRCTGDPANTTVADAFCSLCTMPRRSLKWAASPIALGPCYRVSPRSLTMSPTRIGANEDAMLVGSSGKVGKWLRGRCFGGGGGTNRDLLLSDGCGCSIGSSSDASDEKRGPIADTCPSPITRVLSVRGEMTMPFNVGGAVVDRDFMSVMGSAMDSSTFGGATLESDTNKTGGSVKGKSGAGASRRARHVCREAFDTMTA